ncbi:MAG TPA: molybdate ABC transporter substrate-binding protein [Steroidobacteraceae bacterium]|nr:molybdate ABC transporter substrate-binding protein [Steroidobacteraceae bacterium]
MFRRTALTGAFAALAASTVLGRAALVAEAPREARALVAAASDLKFALDEVVAAFRRDTGLDARVTFGSSGNFARQIEQGAPFELFFSADEAFVERLAAKGLTQDAGKLYGIGRIVLFAPQGSVLVPDPGLANLRALLERDAVTRFAIANPEHAPYGRAAEQALRSQGLWERVQPKLVLGENVSQAAQFASSGDTVGGIFAYSLALAPDVGAKGTFVLLPATLHAPLRQRMVLLKHARPPADRLYHYVQSPPARQILTRYGFAQPER